MDIELVIFDIAGTTMCDDDSVNRFVRDALAASGLSVTAAQVNTVMGLPKPEAIGILIEQSEQLAKLRHQIGAIHDDFVSRAISFYAHDPSVREIPGTTRVFRTLKNAGIRVALDTGFSRSIAQAIFDRLGWCENGLVDASVCSDEVRKGRPHPDMIFSLMRRLAVDDVRRVAKVGDTPADLEEGASAGCGLVVGVTGGTHTRRQLEPHPHSHLIESIADFPRLLGLTLV